MFSFEFSVFVKESHTMKMMIVIKILIMIAIKSIKITAKVGYRDIESSSCKMRLMQGRKCHYELN